MTVIEPAPSFWSGMRFMSIMNILATFAIITIILCMDVDSVASRYISISGSFARKVVIAATLTLASADINILDFLICVEASDNNASFHAPVASSIRRTSWRSMSG